MSRTYDVAVIGAGIAGASVAYQLKQLGQSIAVIDQGPLCSGASGAAGAFISPMLGKPNPLKTFTNDAFAYSTCLFKELVGEGFIQNGVLRLPKDERDEPFFRELEQFIELPYEKRDSGYFFEAAGVIPPDVILPAMLEGCDCYFEYRVDKLERNDRDDAWQFDGFYARNVVLATGGYELLVTFPYPIMRGVWGERIRIETPTRTTHNYHKKVSVSTTVNGNQLLIGATHKKNHDWTVDANAPMELLEKAAEILSIEAPHVLEIKAGMRPGSVDYYPILGAVPDTKKNIEAFESIRHGTKVPWDRLHYIPGLYLHTGHGGRGFVTSPLSAKMLAEQIVNKTPLPENLDAVRFFYRWMRRSFKKS